MVITSDPFGLRNGYVFRTFADERAIEATFGPRFKKIAISYWSDDAWGLQINFFVVVYERL